MTELKKDSVQIKVNKDPFIGTTLGGKYEVVELEGSGAMGKLYRGRHLALDRPVAIKVLHAHLASDAVHMERFNREAKLAASLQHQNVAHVYDVGNAEDGSPYLVMDFLDGRSLAWLIEELGPMPVRRSVPLFIGIAQGLGYAHSKGLLHRDLKLSNIMIVSDGPHEMAKIIDFGIAKSMDPDQANQLTQTGEIFGSPLYMSPEQCQGHQLDARSDIYSFGCVMYETLSGVPPIKGDSPVSTIFKHINEAPKPFAEVAPSVHVPVELEAIIFKALEKEPAKRFKDAAEVVDALQKVLPSLETVAAATSADASPVRETDMPSQDEIKKVGNGFVLILVVLLVVAAGTMAYFLTRPQQKVDAQGRQIVQEYVVDGEPKQFIKDDYLGDDDPVVWVNPAAASQEKDVVVVYTHQTSNQPRSFDMNYEIMGNANVHLTGKHRAKPVVLVLGGYAPIAWHVTVDPSVIVEKVIASGHLQQKVDGLPTGVEVVETSDNLPPSRADRTSKPFEPLGDLSNLGRGEDPTQNSTVTSARETIKKLTGGNDISELHATQQMKDAEL
jgi:hypothetical protein